MWIFLSCIEQVIRANVVSHIEESRKVTPQGHSILTTHRSEPLKVSVHPLDSRMASHKNSLAPNTRHYVTSWGASRIYMSPSLLPSPRRLADELDTKSDQEIISLKQMRHFKNWCRLIVANHSFFSRFIKEASILSIKRNRLQFLNFSVILMLKLMLIFLLLTSECLVLRKIPFIETCHLLQSFFFVNELGCEPLKTIKRIRRRDHCSARSDLMGSG